MSVASESSPSSSPKPIRNKLLLSKDKIGFWGPEKSVLHEDLDAKCLFDFKNPLVRIEYPGFVKNTDSAIETLGGLEEIQKAIDGKKLQLSFHPKSEYTTGCVADVDSSVGFLLKVKRNKVTKEVSYEVVDACDTNFRFYRMCDFQFLPLLSKEKPEHSESEVDYMHNKVVLEKIPTLDWFNKKEKDSKIFLTCGSLARFDQPQVQLKSNCYEVFNSMVRSDSYPLPEFVKKKLREKRNCNSVRVVLKENTEIPSGPAAFLIENIKYKMLHRQLEAVTNLFEERPIWTRTGVIHGANLSSEEAKQVIPCVAYYCMSGPWRTCWIKFGYNPMVNYNSRIYQVLEFRIRHSEGMQMKIMTKKTAAQKISSHLKYVSRNADHIIRPNQIPPARQLSYQYCDIWLPEVQEMLSKLPKLPSTLKYDHKNGWLPLSFQEHCREIVNKYVFEAVQKEIINESNRQKDLKRTENVTSFCSQMLHNIKEKGLHQLTGEHSKGIEQVNLDDSDEEIDVNEFMDSLPERLPRTLAEEEAESDSDMEIDLEAVEEVNELVAGIREKTNL